MVSETGDIPPRGDVEPDTGNIVEDVLDSGEVLVTLLDGSDVELHGHDTYTYDSGYVYTQVGDDDVWFHIDDVTKLVRHYD